MSETRKLAAILAADVAGYSRLAGADEEGTLARLRALRSELIDPTIARHNGRVVKRTGDGILIEFRSVVEAVRCAIEVQTGMVERNSGVPPDRRIEFRVGVHLGDVVEESDGDLMGDGVNIAARLEGVAKPGAICLSEQAYWQVRGRLEFRVTDLGATQLKNIAEPVRAYLVQVGVPTQVKAAPGAKTRVSKKRSVWTMVVVGVGVLLVAISASAGWFLGAKLPAPFASNAPPPAHLSIVVLPFANLSGDSAQDYFADGVTENLTTELSRIHNSFVIARNTAFAFKGKSVDAKAIGKELGVRYVLEGSVQRVQNRVRVNVQLIDAESGAHLWSDRFEDDVADLLKLQDEVVARLANRLGYELVKAEAEKGTLSKTPDAIDLTMRGQSQLVQANLTPTKEAFDSALALFDQALKIDPNEADALSGEASAYGSERTYGWKDEEFGQFGTFATLENEYTRKILAQADRAIALAPDNVQAYSAKSRYLTGLAKANEAVRVAEAGLAFNPNSAPLYEARSIAKMYLGRHEEAKSDIQLALKLSPRDSSLGVWHAILGDAELCVGHFDAAIDAYQKSIDLGFRALQPYTGLAAALALEERMSEAKDALEEARRINPKATIKYLITHERPWVAWYMPNLLNGLKKAGLTYE